MPEPEISESRPRLRIGFLLTPRFTLSAFATFTDVLRLAADDGDGSRQIRCRWRVLSADMGPVQSSCGVRIEPDERLGDPTRFDYVITVGGLIDGGPGLSPDQAAFLKRAALARVPLGGLCTGVFALARIGLMDGYRCCVSWFHHQDFLAEFDRMRPVSDQIFVVDRDRLSCSGGVSAAHLAAFLVDRHIGRAAARKSLSILMIDEPMQGDRPQPGLPLELNARDPLVRRALLAMQQNLHAPLPIARIARDLGVGRRKLERHFNADLGIPPADASVRIRLAQARMLLARTDRTVTRIAEETGFCDASHLIRVFREAEGTTPDLWRQQNAASMADDF
ncbi:MULTISPECIES: GlxA family transcriptional regulator [unclassified Paracoccus (in: a-proteobacteria)]|uniref:GlxA family transcriptional regulator n=1 Tax=unclassified Paracoccus (in: a-proteobacteria) TaxID=2688777 RepID=UPI0012B19366|nr:MULTISPECIES: GlxA family transcriptional regulator [unclassified Paracoccus (in: a-proteobacteria)]UXU73854.1 GlxA family transcriptional regulator [Paracoccus sp. SMMA_5]UXU79742.1 GlxA family transcriptional regulator [Paracoccus sp. SMMA_5_TC]